MPPASKIDLVDEDTRRELDERIIANGFGGYVGLAEWLTERGYSIGKSAVGLYGKNLQRRIDAIKTSTEAARQIAAAAPDDADDRSNAIISLVQTSIFESLIALHEAEDEPNHAERVSLLGKAAKNIATLTRASVARHKWASEVREKLDAAREEVKKLATGAGVSEETMAAIDRRLQGIV